MKTFSKSARYKINIQKLIKSTKQKKIWFTMAIIRYLRLTLTKELSGKIYKFFFKDVQEYLNKLEDYAHGWEGWNSLRR